MAGLSEWDIHKPTGGLVTVSVDLGTPLVNQSSCAIKQKGLSDGFYGANMLLKTYYNAGFTRGYLRTLLRFDVLPDEAAEGTHGGIVCMQSVRDLTGTVGEGYLLGVGRPYSETDIYLVLAKMYAGLASDDTEFDELGIYGPLDVVEGDYMPIQLRWDLEVGVGIQLEASMGLINTLTYNTLAVVIDGVDATPFTTSVGEGLYTRHGASTEVDTMSQTFDETFFRKEDY